MHPLRRLRWRSLLTALAFGTTATLALAAPTTPVLRMFDFSVLRYG